MDSTHDIRDHPLAQAWEVLQAQHTQGEALQVDSNRLAFADPEFLLRRETRGLRMQLEMLKPEVDQHAQGIENTIVVFGSARFAPPEQAEKALAAAQAGNDAAALAAAQRQVRNAGYYNQARLFSRLVASYSQARPAKEQLHICTGGGPGIMEAANRGAHEAGGRSVGLGISLPFEQEHNPFITPELDLEFHYFFVRKYWFLYLAKALVAFPGGFGTMDELFEMLTLIQTKKTKKQFPVLLFGSAFWKNTINFEAFQEWGMVSPEDRDLYIHVDSVKEARDMLIEIITEKYLKGDSETND